eukprot:CAMPEP_0119260592 /NCGR_PEP_ID=MMETSP1329-20130426/901_1 /TAXON_ID=114041 /ORGANISM="Genus nov. species nov., Strain RCC1024" /LENGTH=296 /DNA_ID=CAMNT_0007260017 /DNA_START=104 /DNA_END=991 /DNA_ORIENTATION=+
MDNPPNATLICGATTALGHAVARALLAAGRDVLILAASAAPSSELVLRLRATAGPHRGETFALRDGEELGRSLQLSRDPAVSSRHLAFRGAGIVDLGSTNGTEVDGRRVDGFAPLRAGSEVRVGDTALEVEALENASDAARAGLERAGARVVAALEGLAVSQCADCSEPLEDEAAEAARIERLCAAVEGAVVAASSAAVYGDARRGRPVGEAAFLPREATEAGPYPARERALCAAGRAKPVVALRLFDVFGGDARAGSPPRGLAALVRGLARGDADAFRAAQSYCGDASHVSEAAR